MTKLPENHFAFTMTTSVDSLRHNSNLVLQMGKLSSDLCTICKTQEGEQIPAPAGTGMQYRNTSHPIHDPGWIHRLHQQQEPSSPFCPSTNLSGNTGVTDQPTYQDSQRLPCRLDSSKLITTSCMTTELVFSLHDNSFMSMSVCVCFKLMHESKAVVCCTMHSSACWQSPFP